MYKVPMFMQHNSPSGYQQQQQQQPAQNQQQQQQHSKFASHIQSNVSNFSFHSSGYSNKQLPAMPLSAIPVSSMNNDQLIQHKSHALHQHSLSVPNSPQCHNTLFQFSAPLLNNSQQHQHHHHHHQGSSQVQMRSHSDSIFKLQTHLQQNALNSSFNSYFQSKLQSKL